MVKFWVTFALIVAAIGALSHFDAVATLTPFTFGHNTVSMHAISMGGERGSGVERTDIRQIGDFTRIHAEGAGVLDIDVKLGNAGGTLELTIDDNLLGFVTTDVVDGVLEVSQTANLSPNVRQRLKVSIPKLEGIHLEGANHLNLKIESNDPLELRLEGAGKVKASGKVGQLSVHSEGAGSVDTSELVAPNVEVTLEGAGKARVHATEILKGHIEGAGVITYTGNPKTVEKEIEGVGKISKAD